MKFEEAFNELRGLFINKDVSSIPDVAFQFNIIGEAEGVFYGAVRNGKLSIEPYDYKDNDAVFEAKYEVFKRIIEGSLNPVNAYLTKRIKIYGSLEKAVILEQILK